MSDSQHEIAALFVETRGRYFGIPSVDPWDVERDARKYDGTLPVVAHPPCYLWVNLAAVNWKRYQRERPAWYPGGDDGGCFAAALAAVRRCGGVLEHPAGSWAWKHFGLWPPPRRQGDAVIWQIVRALLLARLFGAPVPQAFCAVALETPTWRAADLLHIARHESGFDPRAGAHGRWPVRAADFPRRRHYACGVMQVVVRTPERCVAVRPPPTGYRAGVSVLSAWEALCARIGRRGRRRRACALAGYARGYSAARGAR